MRDKVGSIERPIDNPINNLHNNAIYYESNSLRYRPGEGAPSIKPTEQIPMGLTVIGTQSESRLSKKLPAKTLLVRLKLEAATQSMVMVTVKSFNPSVC